MYVWQSVAFLNQQLYQWCFGVAKRARKKKSYATLPRPKSVEGLDHLRSGRFKNAIESLKLALKEEQSQSDGLKEFLAEAYVGRAKELSEKGMGKEAAVMLEKSSEITGKPVDPILLFSLLLKVGQIGRAVHALQPLKGNLDGDGLLVGGSLGEVLAGLALTGHDEVLALFKEDSSFLVHYNTARRVLHAYDGGDDETSLELLKKLPIGSPFKNFRLFMHALVLSSSQPENALALLEKIKEDSPYHPMAQAVVIAISGDFTDMGIFATLASPVHGLACRLLNVNAGTIRAISHIQSVATDPDKLAGALLKQDLESHLPKEVLRTLCLPLLPSAIGLLEKFQQRFGPLSQWEIYRIRALALEGQKQWSSAADVWIAALKTIHDPMTKALVYRHLADFPDYRDMDENPWGMLFHSGNRQGYSKIDFLESSLRHDPQDRDTHITLIRLHAKKNSKDARVAVDRAVKGFPEDRDILEAAMDAAFAAKTFKKAAAFAERILSVNPIHQRARRVLVESHLAHARKKVGEKRLDLAHKELLVAESLEKEHARSGRVQICQAMVALLSGQKETGEEKLSAARSLPIGPLEIELMIQSEVAYLKVPSELVVHHHKIFKDLSEKISPDRVSVLSLVQELERSFQDDHLPVRKWMEIMLPFFAKAPALDFSLEERRLICNMLLENDFFDILGLFATVGKKHWEDDGSFLFFDLSSQSKGNATQARYEDLEILREVKGSVYSRLDARTMSNMEKFLSSGRLSFENSPFEYGDEDENDEEFLDMDSTDFESELGPLLEMFQEAIETRIADELPLRRKLGDKKYGERLAKELARGLPMGVEVFAEMISDILADIPLPGVGARK
ncbi:MAG: hypothetical protein HQL75_13300 [Magnetococcales bacterium]|nr:hypothetical protein [Magnetococcales bacterium]